MVFDNQEEVFDFLRKACYRTAAALEDHEGMCKTFFDGYLCWPATKAGHLAQQNCSGELLKSTTEGLASVQCTENGTWSLRENSDLLFTNFSGCGSFFTVKGTTEAPPTPVHPLFPEWVPRIKTISCVGYTISIVSLVISIGIFLTIKRLRCSRNTLHINLFISFIMRSFMSVLKDALFIKGTALALDTVFKDGNVIFPEDIIYSWVCKAIISIRFYFIIANFMFMLMEGMYLHNLMFLKLFSDNHSVAIYCLMGWGLPLLFLIPWVVLRTVYDDLRCWTEKRNIYIALLIDLPIGITIVINFILFLVIVKVLTVKLNNACIQQRKYKYRKLLKATLILIPLFGVPYIFSLAISVFIDREKDPVLVIIWLIFDQSFAAFQGLFAALVYCLLNSEVRVEILRKYSSMKDTHNKEFRRSRTISNTQQFSLPTDDFPDFPETLQDLVLEKGNPEEIVLNKEQHCLF